LTLAVPSASSPVQVLLLGVHQEWYEGRTLSREQIRELKAAAGELRNPAFFKERLRSRFHLVCKIRSAFSPASPPATIFPREEAASHPEEDKPRQQET